MIKKIYNYAKSLDKRFKFILVGGMNTVIGYGINALVLLLVFGIPLTAESKATEVQALISSVTGHIFGMINAYFWNKYFTFECREKSFSQVSKFLLISVSQLALSYSLIMLFQNVIGLGVYPSQIITLVITTLFSYAGHNNITFKKQESENTGCKDTEKRSI